MERRSHGTQNATCFAIAHNVKRLRILTCAHLINECYVQVSRNLLWMKKICSFILRYLHTPMSESVVRPFTKNVGSVGVKFAKACDEVPRQNVTGGIIDDTEVDGEAPRRNSTKVSNSGLLNFQ